jgi:hypothetical protein
MPINDKLKYPVFTGKIAGFKFDLTQGVIVRICVAGEIVQFWRVHGQWRRQNGPCCSKHELAAILFEHPNKPPPEQIKIMADWVDNLGRALDAMPATYRGFKQQYQRDRKQAKADKPSCLTSLYLMKHVNGLTKIGKSKRPRIREKTLQAEDPRLSLIFVAHGKGHLEDQVHEMFSGLRVRGEWFDLDQSDIETIKIFTESHCQDTSRSELG